MKNLVRILTVALVAFCTSCVVYGGVPQKLDEFVTRAEKNSASYTKEDWQNSRTAYKALLDEYKNTQKDFSAEDKELAVRAMGRYNALLIKNGIIKSSMGIQEFSAMLPDFIKGLSEGLEANSDEITRSLKSLVDSEKLSSAVSSLSSALEKIFTAPEE